jgi:hypothetical protein
MEIEDRPIIRNFRPVGKIRRHRTYAKIPTLDSINDPMSIKLQTSEKPRNVFGDALDDMKRYEEERKEYLEKQKLKNINEM